MVEIVCGEILVDWILLIVGSSTIQLPIEAQINLDETILFGL
jgi:hypothetical protein